MNKSDEFLLSEYDYDLPPEMIAQEPLADRDKSRLLVLHRKTGEIQHRQFTDVLEYLKADDLLVMNDTQVTALRLRGVKPTGGNVEALLLRDLGDNKWYAAVKPGRRVGIGAKVIFGDGALTATVVERGEAGGRVLDFGSGEFTAESIQKVGEIPLPPYIHSTLKDASRYQTVYASQPGSAAAPTAGFHFTPDLMAAAHKMGVHTAKVTLNVGLATFRPVRTELITDHEMHKEVISVSPETAETINSSKGRVIAVGTTTVRALESAAVTRGKVKAFSGETGLFVTPGYEFKIIDSLITNFHMPKSTLMILVSTFAGRENIQRAYTEAKREGYRFLSFGDAMLII